MNNSSTKYSSTESKRIYTIEINKVTFYIDSSCLPTKEKNDYESQAWNISFAKSAKKNRLFIAKWVPSFQNGENQKFLGEYEAQTEISNELKLASKNYVVSLDKHWKKNKDNINKDQKKEEKKVETPKNRNSNKPQKNENGKEFEYLLIYELFESHTLKEYISKSKFSSDDQKYLVGILIGNAIESLHKIGISHNNLESSNILIKDKPLEVKLCGLSKAKVQNFNQGNEYKETDIRMYKEILGELGLIKKSNEPKSVIETNQILQNERIQNNHIHYLNIEEELIDKMESIDDVIKQLAKMINKEEIKEEKTIVIDQTQTNLEELLNSTKEFLIKEINDIKKTKKKDCNQIYEEQKKGEREAKSKPRKNLDQDNYQKENDDVEMEESEEKYAIHKTLETNKNYIELKIIYSNSFIKESEIIEAKGKSLNHLNLTEINLENLVNEKSEIIKEISEEIISEIKYQKYNEDLKIRKLKKCILCESPLILYLFYEFSNVGRLRKLGTESSIKSRDYKVEELKVISIDIYKGLKALINILPNFQQIDPTSIWLSENIFGNICEAKIQDFGLMNSILKFVSDISIKEPFISPIHYLAPELVSLELSNKYSEVVWQKDQSIDKKKQKEMAYVFCYGLILYYILFRNNPLSDENNKEKFLNATFGIYGNMFNFQYVENDDNFLQNFHSLIGKCLYFNPPDRIPFENIPKDEAFENSISLDKEKGEKEGTKPRPDINKLLIFKEDFNALINDRKNKSLNCQQFISIINTDLTITQDTKIKQKSLEKDKKKYLIETYSQDCLKNDFLLYLIQKRITLYNSGEVKKSNVFQKLLKYGFHTRNNEEYFSLIYEETVTLWDFIKKKIETFDKEKKDVLFKESEIRSIMKQLIYTLRFLHKNLEMALKTLNVTTIFVHTDENSEIIGIESSIVKAKERIENFSIKVSFFSSIDSKLENDINWNNPDLELLFIDPLYVGRKRFKNKFSSDFWSLSLILYILYFGRPPSYKLEKLKFMRQAKEMTFPEIEDNQNSSDSHEKKQLLELLPKIKKAINFYINEMDDEYNSSSNYLNYFKLFYESNIFPYDKGFDLSDNSYYYYVMEPNNVDISPRREYTPPLQNQIIVENVKTSKMNLIENQDSKYMVKDSLIRSEVYVKNKPQNQYKNKETLKIIKTKDFEEEEEEEKEEKEGDK